MKLIVETVENVEFVTEAVGDKKSHYITGVFMQAGIVNKNGRKYSPDVMESAVNKYITEKINNRCAYGELGHPASPTINLDRTAILIKSLKREDNNWVGKALITSTPSGDIVNGLLGDGANLGVSSRGMGSLKENKGFMDVMPDFVLAAAADIVADPSAPDAFVRGIMENVEWLYDENKGWIKTLAEEIDNTKKQIKQLTIQEIEEQKLQIFENFLSKLAKI